MIIAIPMTIIGTERAISNQTSIYKVPSDEDSKKLLEFLKLNQELSAHKKNEKLYNNQSCITW